MNYGMNVPTGKRSQIRNRATEETCDTCRGWGWLYMRGYYICPDCQDERWGEAERITVSARKEDVFA